MPSLSMNLVKRIDRLPKPTSATSALQPLFEAVSNSIHAVTDKFGKHAPKKGHIVVTVSTDRRKSAIKATVEDNGMGLDKKNFEAFLTTDTDNKFNIGGKGVGRLLWLDCFENVHVDSHYMDGESLRHRKFDFVLSSTEQVKNYSDRAAHANASQTGVTITFSDVRNNGYLEKFPGRKSFVLQHFASHFLPTFIAGHSPRVSIHCGDETKEYPDAIDDLIHRRTDVDDIETEAYGKLRLVLMECSKVASADLDGSHVIHFIAHDRTVKSQRIDGKLGIKYFGPENDRVFQACLFGKYLDKSVNQERTNFTFGDDVVEDIVNTVCMPSIEQFLSEPLAKHKSAQSTVVQNITESYPSVAFGKVSELQDHIPLGELSADAIFGHLSRERFRRDEKQTRRLRDVLSRLKSGKLSAEAFAKAVKEASQEIEAAEQRSLAEYIVRRKVVLDFLDILLENVRDDSEDSSYQREDVLHSFICPMRINALVADEGKRVEASSHELWVIDERLALAEYFSSDVPFKELASAFKSEERADILIFDKVHGLRQTDDSSKILLVEFKRPGRTSYRDDENPQQQVERYVRQLLSGSVLDVRGRPIKLKPETIFYCFIVADIIGRLDEWTFSWSRTPDGRGRIYQPRSGFNGTIEVMGWDGLLADARERNKAFFDRAGLSAKNVFA